MRNIDFLSVLLVATYIRRKAYRFDSRANFGSGAVSNCNGGPIDEWGDPTLVLR